MYLISIYTFVRVWLLQWLSQPDTKPLARGAATTATSDVCLTHTIRLTTGVAA